jgi:hypothetical protein
VKDIEDWFGAIGRWVSRATSVSDRQFRLNLHPAFDGPVAKLFRKTFSTVSPFTGFAI